MDRWHGTKLWLNQNWVVLVGVLAAALTLGLVLVLTRRPSTPTQSCCKASPDTPCAYDGACGATDVCVPDSCSVAVPREATADWSGTWTGSGRTVASLDVQGGKYVGTGACNGDGCAWGAASKVAASGDDVFLAWPDHGVAVTLQLGSDGAASVVGTGDVLKRTPAPTP